MEQIDTKHTRGWKKGENAIFGPEVQYVNVNLLRCIDIKRVEVLNVYRVFSYL